MKTPPIENETRIKRVWIPLLPTQPVHTPCLTFPLESCRPIVSESQPVVFSILSYRARKLSIAMPRQLRQAQAGWKIRDAASGMDSVANAYSKDQGMGSISRA